MKTVYVTCYEVENEKFINVFDNQKDLEDYKKLLLNEIRESFKDRRFDESDLEGFDLTNISELDPDLYYFDIEKTLNDKY